MFSEGCARCRARVSHGNHREPQIRDHKEQWFSSSEARNLACDNVQDCDTGITDVQDDVAEEREWVQPGGEEIESTITENQVEEYHDAWQLTQGEIDHIELEEQEDFEGDFSLPFSSDEIRNMIDEVLSLL